MNKILFALHNCIKNFYLCFISVSSVYQIIITDKRIIQEHIDDIPNFMSIQGYYYA